MTVDMQERETVLACEDNIAIVPGVLEKVITVHHKENEDMFKWR